ncbi:MAG: DUF3078 domain-containing protein [bacterium]
MGHWIFMISFLSVAFSAFAQEPDTTLGWKNEIVGTLNLTQASFDNWQQGGENTLAWQVTLNAGFILQQEKFNWTTKSKFTFGFAKVEGSEAKKSADEIKIESVYIRKLGRALNPFFSVTAQTQAVAAFEFNDDGSKTQISKFLDPAYFTQSAGVGYKPGDIFQTRLGATIKETITRDFPQPFADDPGTLDVEKTKVEPGISSVTEFRIPLHENIVLNSKLDIFSDFEGFDRIDVLWENNLTMKVSKLINVAVTADLFYDKDISERRQIRQILAIGFTYSFL